MRSLLIALVLSAAALGQVNLSFVTSFTHPIFAGNGTIGACFDSYTGEIWVVDFSNAVNLHRFDLSGNLLSSHPTNTCNPAMTSPNDITQNRLDGTLWLVDNDTGGEVLNFSTTGACIGGFTLGSAYSNPVSIAYNMNTNDLRIGHTNSIATWSTAGANLGINFAPGTYAGIVSGLTHIPASDHYLMAAGTTLIELDGSGNLIGPVAIGPQGSMQAIDYDPFSGMVVVADNTNVTLSIYQDLNVGVPYQVNQAQAQLLVNGVSGTGTIPAIVPLSLGQSGVLSLTSSLVGVPFELAIGLAPLVPGGGGAIQTIDNQLLNIDVTDPSLVFLFNLFQSPPFSAFSIPFNFSFPISFSVQFAVIDTSTPSNLRFSQPSRVIIQ